MEGRKDGKADGIERRKELTREDREGRQKREERKKERKQEKKSWRFRLACKLKHNKKKNRQIICSQETTCGAGRSGESRLLG